MFPENEGKCLYSDICTFELLGDSEQLAEDHPLWQTNCAVDSAHILEGGVQRITAVLFTNVSEKYLQSLLLSLFERNQHIQLIGPKLMGLQMRSRQCVRF